MVDQTTRLPGQLTVAVSTLSAIARSKAEIDGLMTQANQSLTIARQDATEIERIKRDLQTDTGLGGKLVGLEHRVALLEERFPVPPQYAVMQREDICAIQARLAALKLFTGRVAGDVTEPMRIAVRNWQASIGAPPDGALTKDQLAKLVTADTRQSCPPPVPAPRQVRANPGRRGHRLAAH